MDNLKFEEALSKLEDIVRQLESGETPLDESLQLFEDGVKLKVVRHPLTNRFNYLRMG